MDLKALCTRPPAGLTKTLRVMKITAIIILSACLTASANGFSQKVTLSEKNATLDKVFKEIKKQTGYKFLYTDEMLQRAERISIELKNADLIEALNSCFENQPLTYSIIEKTIVVKARMAETEKLNLPPPPITVRGKVLNENGEPVVASVIVKGTTNGTTTNAEGYFTLSNIDENAILVISAVSIETIEIKINGRTDLEIRAKTKVTEGESVTVNTGYWTSDKKTSTGNITKITAKEIEKQPVNNPILALQGRVAGLNIEQVSGVPGGGFRNLQIRGQNSVRFDGNDPLFVIDGTPFPSQNLSGRSASDIFPNPLNLLNPSDIESIEVLKDADATAIYGSLGANGVILITTKKGRTTGTSVEVNFYTGAGKVMNRVNLLNTQQYLEMRKEAFVNDNITPTASNAPDLLLWDNNRYTDWQDKLIGGTAHITNANLSVSGGNELTRFFAGGGYLRETAVFPGSFPYQKGSLNLGGSHTSGNKKLEISFKTNLVRENSTLPITDLTRQALTLSPNAPAPFDANGKLNWQGGTWTNPYAILLKKYDGRTTSVLTNLTVSYQILPGLQVQNRMGFNLIENDIKETTPLASYSPTTTALGEIRMSRNQIKTWIAEPQLTYSKGLGKLKLDVLLGTTFRETVTSTNNTRARGFTDDTQINNPMAAANYNLIFDNSVVYRYNGTFARVGINHEGRYFINLSGRRDGSSRFSEDNRFGNFGAVGAAWLFSKEKFFSDIPYVSFGKLKVSYGTVGNDQIGDYQYLSTYRFEPAFYPNGVPLTLLRLANPEYKWESVRKIEYGLELGFLNDQIRINVYHYRNRSSNQLIAYPLPAATGFSSITANLDALIENKGFEFELNTVNLVKSDFKWTSYINLTIPRNKLLQFPKLAGSSYATSYIVGEPLFIGQMYRFNGISDQGLYQFFDFDNNGSISSPADNKEIVNRVRDLFGGFQNTISYKGFGLDFLFQFVKQTGPGYQDAFPNIAPGGISNQPAFVMSRWQKPGDITEIQKFSTGGNASGAYFNYGNSNAAFTNASFTRLKNLAISYQFPAGLVKKAKIQNLRIYIQAQNLFTITRYNFLDPETRGNLPPIKMITAGVQLML